MSENNKKLSNVKGTTRFLVECVMKRLGNQEKVHLFDKHGVRSHGLELRIIEVLANLSVLLEFAIFSDEVGLLISSAGPNVSRDLLRSAINGLAYKDLASLTESVAENPSHAASLMADTKIGLEFLDRMCVFSDDEI